jgi:hypothetical protein
VDDFVLVWEKKIEGNSIKWSGDATPLNWGEFIGTNGLLNELADGYKRLQERWPDKTISVRLVSNRPPSPEKHHAQIISTFSLTEFVNDFWPSGPTDHDIAQVAAVWSKISQHVGLTGQEFSKFVKSCTINLGHPEPPGGESDSQDWQHYKKQFEDLHKAIAIWLTNNPHGDFINRDILLAAIGFRGYRSGLIQRFPPPKIPYSKNGTSAEKLKQLIEKTEGGYIAVVGPAGIGKSTLVQDLLSEGQYPFFIPYFAFLPDTDGNRERGEALTFFQDVIERLDKFFVGRNSLGISDVAQGRDALRGHMATANKEYVIQGNKTILLIDGLDHVSREINLRSPLLQELPTPDEVPNGFLIILSSQPQALIPGTITAEVGTVVATPSGRRIEVSGLTRTEVHEIFSQVEKATTGTERDALYNASQGNPLILTYLLNLFRRTSEITVDEAITLAGNYVGDIDAYYQSRLAIPLRDAQTRQLLGLLARAAPTIPVLWLQQEWPERVQLENIFEHTLAPFVHAEEGNLQFIHNSLIAFLKSTTRSKLPGADPIADEHQFHSTLADRCGNRPCADPLGRAKVLHLLRASKHGDVLTVLSSVWLRNAIEAFLPYALIRPLVLSGFEAAWSLKDIGHVLRLILLDHELAERAFRMEAGKLLETLLSLDKPDLAISQVRAVGRLIVEDGVVLGFAHSLWFYADTHERSELKSTARALYFQAKPISFFYQNEQIDTMRHREHYSLLQSWADAAPLFEDCGSIVAQIMKLRFKDREYGENVDEAAVKSSLMYRTLLTMCEMGAERTDCQTLIDTIVALGRSTWHFAVLLALARRKLSNVSVNELKVVYSKIKRDSDIDLAYAQFLYGQGHRDEAKEIVVNLSHIRFEGFRNDHSHGFSDISYTVALRRLQDLLGLPEGSVPGVKDAEEEAVARVERAARQLGILSAINKKGKIIQNLDTSLRSLLLFHNQSVIFSEFDWRNKYAVDQSKREIYEHILSLAASIGTRRIELLRDIFLDLVNGPAADQFPAHHRRFFAKQFFLYKVLSKEKAIEVGLSSTIDATDDDPLQRQEACFEIASLLHSIGEDMLSNQWFKRAGEVSAGAGSHKDYHMGHLAEWLSRSIGNTLKADKLEILEKFARAVEVSGGDGASDAAMSLLRSVIHEEPIRASRLAVELIDRGVLNVCQTLDALITGGAAAGASAEILIVLYNELLSLIDPLDISAAAVTTLLSFPAEQRITAAIKIMGSVRTNTLPSRRIAIAREIQDALRKDGLGEHILTQGLKPGQDDSSSKRSLYRRAAGETETIDQVAARLSNRDNPQQWNPNPAHNAEFEWWEAIKKTTIKDPSHLNDLLSLFPPSDYREFELLAWKSERLFEMGDRKTARLLAEQAIERARDGSWHLWLDGAQKKIAFNALKKIDANKSLQLAWAQFGKDLSAGKLNSTYLLHDILGIIDFLEIEWPSEFVCRMMNDYLEHVLNANIEVRPYTALIQDAKKGSADEALCRFIVHLLAFPVVDVGVAARRALSSYAATNGKGLADAIKSGPCWDSVQLEYILACLHTGMRCGKVDLNRLRDWIADLNRHESIAVRGIARRICEEQGWPWEEVRNQTKHPIILLFKSLKSPSDYEEARMLIDGDVATALLLHRRIFGHLERSGLDADELKSEFYRIYEEIEKDYSWSDSDRLKRWIRLVLAEMWLLPRGFVGREAAMRILGRRALSGEVPSGAEHAYNYLYPIYDPTIELRQAIERPVELQAMDWERSNDYGNGWRSGENADSWANYPELVDGLHIIGERTWLIRPDWERPREERYRGLIIGPCDAPLTRDCLQTSYELTFDRYMRGEGQEHEQLIVLNSERQLVGPAYRWAAINCTFARALGWRPSDDDEPFTWVDYRGNLMVKSVYWKDGWIWLEPPRFEPLGEGWLVLATEQGIESMRTASNNIESHLWVERYSHGEKPYEGKWHLSKCL